MINNFHPLQAMTLITELNLITKIKANDFSERKARTINLLNVDIINTF